jgi:chemotaxis protein methyltransferase CheR
LLESLELTDRQFGRISELVRRQCGINLHDGKKELVKSRLAKRLRQLSLPGFDAYLDLLGRQDAEAETVALIDAISTNETSFFREPDHFDYLSQELLPKMVERNRRQRRLRIWSAGCSSGEEPYSIAIAVRQHMGSSLEEWDVKILATDISTRVLGIAAEGVYDESRLQRLPRHLRGMNFTREGTGPQRRFRVSAAIRRLVHFARLNLMNNWPMRGPFDAVFCRNVMIYFDRETREQLVGRFRTLLAEGGTFFVGHSESLTGIRHQYRYVRPTIYEKA